jgi:hypothetical protein
MVINGASRRSVGFWTKHLANDKKNDRAELKEIRGLAAENLRDALLEMQDDARHTRCKNFFYQANFNPAPNERLTEQQWERTFEIFEKHRGIPEGTARIVYEHEKEGRVHRHVIWSRVDLENMRAWPDRLDAKVCHAASREISEELGLQRTISPYDKDRQGPRPERAPESWEMFRGLKTGLDPRDIKAEVTKIYRDSENAADFVAGLRQHGYQLVQGDRRDYCIVDPAGEVHSLARRIDGVNAKELRAFMQDIQRDSFPTVEQARAQYRERMMDERKADLAIVQREIAWEEALAKAAIEKERTEKRFVEPTPQEVRDKEARDKLWPVRPPSSEQAKTSPRYHFDDTAREATSPEPEPVMPENLKGTAARIWNDYHQSDSARAFVAALDEHQISLASVTEKEAERSQINADFAREVHRFAPRYRAGEIVAVTEQGYVYKLSQRTTGDERRDVKKFLKSIDRTQLQGIEDTKTTLKSRAEERTHEVQSFRERLRAGNEASRLEQAQKPGRQGSNMGHGRDKVSPRIERIATTVSLAAIDGAFSVADKLADGLLGIFDPVLTPQQKLKGEISTREREADAQERVNLSDYAAERAAQRQQQLEHHAEQENRPRDHGRER